ncbi:stage V sporulation protein B [Paenibacillus contaminans]|uniref:Stage V sporulation protein B n=1 Tax=Paenibacillus contaminans TaxID=450362 RepID=A0A329MZ84_9BACL|nr:stage V sporulation protein B [Paenibacillus contaminans]RAV22877.1 stage V sporulation protein B [Paenibacillus contaminans]
MEMRKQSFIRGTVVLTSAAFFTRALGFINGILLARMLGKEGIGLLMTAHPLLPLFITLTELGLPAAISKLVSEAETQNNPARVRKILVVSLTITGVLSVVLTTFALLASKWIAAVFLPDQRAYYAMLALTPIIPLVAITAVLRGYFRGKQNMNPLAFSDIIETLVQIGFVIGLVQWLLPYGVEYATAGAMISVVIGEGAGLLYLFLRFSWYRKTKSGTVPPRVQSDEKFYPTMRDLLHLGLPLTGSGFVHSLFRAFLPMLVTHSLLLSGVSSAAEATKSFGLLTGYVLPLLFLPSFFTQSLSTALIPAISEASASSNSRLMHRRMDIAMRIALFVGVPCTIILYVWAIPLATVLYRAPEAGPILRLMVPLFFLYYFEAPMHAILLGLGKSSTVMWNLIITNLFQIAVIFALGSKFGIQGVALGFAFGICLLTVLNFLSISSTIGFYLDFRMIVKAGIGAAAMTFCGLGTYAFMQRYGSALPLNVLGAVCVSLLAYVMTLRIARVFREV